MTDEREFQADDPESLREFLQSPVDEPISIDIPVLVGAQDSRDIAHSIFEATYIAESLAPGFESPTLSIEDDETNPNREVARLRGAVKDPQRLLSFMDEWSDTLEGNGEPFSMGEDASILLERLESKEPVKSFRWPELATWFRDVRAHFDEWDPD